VGPDAPTPDPARQTVGIDVELLPEVQAVVRGTDDRRFTRGALKSAVRWAAPDATSATVVALTLDVEPPTLVAHVEPGGQRLVLYAGESRWTLTPQRVHKLQVPARGDELDWVVATLLQLAETPAVPAEVRRWTEDLGMGEHRSVRATAGADGEIRLTAEVAEHEIYDGATPRWTVLWGTIDGLPDGASATLAATLRDEWVATLVVSEPRSISPSDGGR
jgi:hypothetical protein